MTNILDHWPLALPPRNNQVKAFDWLQAQSAKYLILEAPVGSGKSVIGLTFSRYLSASGRGDSFILTPQRILQEQYETTLGDHHLFSVYGKSNYECAQRRATCDIGSLFKKKCPNCPARLALETSKQTANTVMNYKLALLHFYHTDCYEKRHLMILDECHSTEEHLTELNTVVVYAKKAEKFKANWQTKTSLVDALKWVEDEYLPQVRKFFDKSRAEYEDIRYRMDSNEELSQYEIKFLKDREELEEHVADLRTLLDMDKENLEEKFVLVFDKDMMKFKKLSGAENFELILKPKAERFLFMSSTILDYKEFCRDLGIDPSEAAFLSLDSEFPKENRPVIYLPQMKMNMSWSKPEHKPSREKMIKTISKILEVHKGESGIIHTGNFKIADWLVEQLEFDAPQNVLHHNPTSKDNRNDIINEFTNSVRPALLVSPSITEGLDLVGDRARFAIFAKVPFGNLGDQWVKKRFEMSQKWYQRKAIIDIIQGGGRIVRSESDWGVTYILDSSFGYLLSQTRYSIPEWWIEAFQVSS